MDIALIKDKILTLLQSQGYRLFEITSYEEEGQKILSVILDESLDLTKISDLSPRIYALLGEDFAQNYILDVTCVGIERPLRTLEEASSHIGEYIFLKLRNEKEILGDLLSINAQEIKLNVKVKNLVKEVSVPYNEVISMRLAVKF